MNYNEIILRAIGTGEEHAVHRAELVQLTGLCERDVRRVIEQLRRGGAVICSDEHGYFRPADLNELLTYCRQEEARSRSIYRRTASARRLLKAWRELEAFEGASLLNEGTDLSG